MTNERRRKLPPKKGVENKGFIDDEGKDNPTETPRKMKKKSANTTSIIDKWVVCENHVQIIVVVQKSFAKDFPFLFAKTSKQRLI